MRMIDGDDGGGDDDGNNHATTICSYSRCFVTQLWLILLTFFSLSAVIK